MMEYCDGCAIGIGFSEAFWVLSNGFSGMTSITPVDWDESVIVLCSLTLFEKTVLVHREDCFSLLIASMCSFILC